ncbi:MAG: lipid-A-disaccharide synthase, partial [Thermodesulfovibrio sp.]|nr:lipid-A-disaccharide synthase [Thermodesulfovibrio sp.]
MPSKKLLIVAGESSGELYGALLAKQLIKDFELFGIGGKYMKEAGVNIIGDITHAFGLFEVFGHLRKLKQNLKIAEETLRKVDGVILIDFPDFNLKLAGKAKKLGKKVLYYVSPQIWAWRKGRIKIIKKYVDYMAVILPFEEKIYKDAGISVKYVGHPMYELMKQELGNMGIRNENTLTQEDKKIIREKFRIKSEIVITLMPGSRPSEIDKKMPLMLNLIDLFDKDKIHFIIPKAPNIEFEAKVREKLSKMDNVTILNEKSFTALAMSDVALITSGTSTLQATLLHIPMIVVYKLNPLSYLVGKLLIKGVKHISLPNVIPDFMKLDEIRIP